MSGFGWSWGRRTGRGRPIKPRMIKGLPNVGRFIPFFFDGKPVPARGPPIVMTVDEFEAIRLVDYEGLLQEEAAKRMSVSRGTVWRCLSSARKKIATMLVEGRELVILSEDLKISDTASRL